MKRSIKIEGMSCGHCVNHVKAALEALSEVESVTVSLEDKRAVITGNASEASIREAIDEAGYEAVEICPV